MTMQETLVQKLSAAFQIEHLQVENESHMHNVPPGSESHFKVVLVTPDFEGKRKVQQHQAVYQVLAAELAGSIHALALHTYDPAAWLATGVAPASPNCMGGSKHDH